MATMQEIIDRITGVLENTGPWEDVKPTIQNVQQELQQVWGDFESGSAAALTQLRGEKTQADTEIQRLQAELYKMHVALGSETPENNETNKTVADSYEPITDLGDILVKNGR